MPQRCRVCAHPERKAIDKSLQAGTTDHDIAVRYGLVRISVSRHRQEHLIKPLQDQLAIVDKDRVARQEQQKRRELAAAAASDEPSIQAQVEAIVGTRALLAELSEIKGMLKRGAAQAEAAGSPTGMAAIAGQQIRGLEFGARLGGNRNFVPSRIIGEAGEATHFAVNIIFNDTGKTESISIVGNPHRTLDANDADWADENAVLSESSSRVFDVSDEQPSANSDDSKQE
jgi:hypothetical protein